MVGQRMGAIDQGWKEIPVKLVELNTKTREREERGDKQESMRRQASYTQTKRQKGGGKKGRKKSIHETPSLPHLVQSRWVCASLQQQAHDVGLVLLRRHVKGRLSILQVGRGKEERGKKKEGMKEKDRDRHKTKSKLRMR